MSKKRRVYFDKTEIMCSYDERVNFKTKFKKMALTYDQIQSVTIKPCIERKGLKSHESECITIRSSKLIKPIEYYKLQNARFYNEYKEGFRLFCHENRVTLYDEIEESVYRETIDF